jgi:hypothetical protein
MRHLLTTVVALSVLGAASGAQATGSSYGWTISASNTDPYQNTTPFVGGLKTVYLWYACSTPAPGPGGMSAAELAICPADPGNLVLAVSPQNGFLNAGTSPDMLLAIGGCPTGPVVAANVIVFHTVPGQWCLCPSGLNAVIGAVDCAPAPQIHEFEWVGLYVGTGQEPCSDGEAQCERPISVEGRSWGELKGLYR